jgi:hypothetical protein
MTFPIEQHEPVHVDISSSILGARASNTFSPRFDFKHATESGVKEVTCRKSGPGVKKRKKVLHSRQHVRWT